MKKIGIAILLSFFPISSWAGRTVKHDVQSTETAWFLAQVYYGTGLKYVEILKANRLENADALRAGMKVKIVDPRFESSQPNFAERYQRLAGQRDQKLKMQKTQIEKPETKGVLPVGHHKKSKLPSADQSSNSSSSPAAMAIEELKKSMRTSEDHQ
jgi:hypothetical protein